MTEKERLEEIKAQYHLLTRNGYDLGAWDEPFSWLIERVQELEEHVEKNRDYLYKCNTLNERLERQNKRYRDALELYANKKTYKYYKESYIDLLKDGGHTAREALETDNGDN